MSTSQSVAVAYVRAVNEKALESLSALFAENAVALNATGELKGRDDIAAFYRDTVFPTDLLIEAKQVYEAGDSCIVELEGTSPGTDVVYRMVDIFTLGSDGLVSRLAVYRR